MGVRFEWANDDHFVVYTYIEFPWTWEEYRALLDVMMAEIKEETHPVATIVNIAEMRTFPVEGNVMQNLQWIEKIMPANVFGSVIVGASHVAKSFMNVMMQIRPRSRQLTMFSETMEGAHEMLAKRYQEIYPEGQFATKISTAGK